MLAKVHNFNNDIKSSLPLISPSDTILSGGEPPMGSDDIETRVRKLEYSFVGMNVTVNHIHEDVTEIKSEVKSLRLWLIGMGVTIIIGISGVVVGAFSWFQHDIVRLETQIDKIETKVNDIEKKLDKLLEHQYPHP